MQFYAFQERLAEALEDTTLDKNVLSFGDSHVEREAIRAVTRYVHTTCIRFLKFCCHGFPPQQFWYVFLTFDFYLTVADTRIVGPKA